MQIRVQDFSVVTLEIFLTTPMAQAEYMRVPLKFFPLDLSEKYNVQKLVHTNGHVYIKIKKGVYGLNQAAVLAYTQLYDRLKLAGYVPILGSTGMWKHKERKTVFCLCR